MQRGCRVDGPYCFQGPDMPPWCTGPGCWMGRWRAPGLSRRLALSLTPSYLHPHTEAAGSLGGRVCEPAVRAPTHVPGWPRTALPAPSSCSGTRAPRLRPAHPPCAPPTRHPHRRAAAAWSSLPRAPEHSPGPAAALSSRARAQALQWGSWRSPPAASAREGALCAAAATPAQVPEPEAAHPGSDPFRAAEWKLVGGDPSLSALHLNTQPPP